ncbi:hypothetical protein [Herbaspirillum sp. AP21]|nr:hypothetical protein [Herbaspirillum sp. AP21]
MRLLLLTLQWRMALAKVWAFGSGPMAGTLALIPKNNATGHQG